MFTAFDIQPVCLIFTQKSVVPSLLIFSLSAFLSIQISVSEIILSAHNHKLKHTILKTDKLSLLCFKNKSAFDKFL
jgi:hypothetical protein